MCVRLSVCVSLSLSISPTLSVFVLSFGDGLEGKPKGQPPIWRVSPCQPIQGLAETIFVMSSDLNECPVTLIHIQSTNRGTLEPKEKPPLHNRKNKCYAQQVSDLLHVPTNVPTQHSLSHKSFVFSPTQCVAWLTGLAVLAVLPSANTFLLLVRLMDNSLFSTRSYIGEKAKARKERKDKQKSNILSMETQVIHPMTMAKEKAIQSACKPAPRICAEVHCGRRRSASGLPDSSPALVT